MNLKRDIYDSLIRDIKRPETAILTGPRQVGKTTLLREIKKVCDSKKISSSYYNLELPSDAAAFAVPRSEVVAKLKNSGKVVFIDEFHYLPDATGLFKAMYDGYPGTKIFASGSSAIEMYRHMKESLAGRRIIYRVFPLSFPEWLPSKKTGVLPPQRINERLTAKASRILTSKLEEFVIYGGMPGLTRERNAEDKKRLLLDLVSTYIQKDIKALLRDEDVISFNRLLAMLAANAGGIISELSMSNDLNYSLRQVRKDLTILNQMFILYSIKTYSTNRGRELKQSYKGYFFDNGIRNALVNDFRAPSKRPDRGVLYESFVLTELRKSLSVSQEIYFWRTRNKEEVDFVLLKDRVPSPVEVKAGSWFEGVPRGIMRFIKIYPECRRAFVLNKDNYQVLKKAGKTIYILPHYYAHLLPKEI